MEWHETIEKYWPSFRFCDAERPIWEPYFELSSQNRLEDLCRSLRARYPHRAPQLPWFVEALERQAEASAAALVVPWHLEQPFRYVGMRMPSGTEISASDELRAQGFRGRDWKWHVELRRRSWFQLPIEQEPNPVDVPEWLLTDDRESVVSFDEGLAAEWLFRPPQSPQ